MGEKREDPLEALPIIQHSWDGGGGGGSFPNDSHLSKLWMMQPQHSPSQHPVGGRGYRGREGSWECQRQSTRDLSFE